MSDRTSLVEAKRTIVNYLNQSLLAALAVRTPAGLRSFMMLFGNDRQGNLFLCTPRGSLVERAVRHDPEVAICISREEDLLEDIAALSVWGTAELLEDPAAQETLYAYDMLNQKSPILGTIPALGEAAKYLVLRIAPREFRFQVYRDYLAGAPGLVLRKS